jgi:pimeloyl-ACP methyl ester carboxylesterase
MERPSYPYRIRGIRLALVMAQIPTKLIFLPGAGGDPAFWQPVAALMAHPAQRTLLGWPGFGAQPADPRVTGIDDLVEMVTAELDQPSAIVAQSMGGVVAVRAALACPGKVTHLVLVATSGGIDVARLGAYDWRREFVAANSSLPRWFIDDRSDLSRQIASIAIPTLLLWGGADPISPVAVGRELDTLLPDSRLHVFDGAEHDLGKKLAAEVAPMIDAHLSRAARSV